MVFMGVQGESLEALGCITVAAGRLEGWIRTLAGDLGVYPGKAQPAELLKLIKTATLPSHATVGSAEVTAWVEEAGNAIYERHRPAHSQPIKVFDGEAWEAVLAHLRTNEHITVEPVRLMAVANRLRASAEEAGRLVCGVRRCPRAGVFLPNFSVDGLCAPLVDSDAGTTRPTPDEMEAWWQAYPPGALP